MDVYFAREEKYGQGIITSAETLRPEVEAIFLHPSQLWSPFTQWCTWVELRGL
jgi:hypothetical protein